MECMICESTNDVIDFMAGDEKLVLCASCRYKMATGQLAPKKMGRPSKGTTKKVSLTLQDNVWDYLDEEAAGNRSDFLRKLIENEMVFGSDEWSNQAALGYAIFASIDLGYEDEEIKKIVRAMYRAFDFKTLEEAKDKYRNSDY